MKNFVIAISLLAGSTCYAQTQESLEKKIDGLVETTNSLKERMENLTKQRDSLYLKADTIGKEIKYLKNVKDSLSTVINNQKRNVITTQINFDSAFEELKSLYLLINKVDSLEQKTLGQQDQNDFLKNELYLLNNLYNELKSKSVSLNFQIYSLNKELLKAKRANLPVPLKRFFLSINAIPSIAYRSLSINEEGFNQQEELKRRQYSDKSDLRLSFAGSFGFNITKNHRVYVELMCLNQGFQSKKSKVDWTTGFAEKQPGLNEHYKFSYLSYGLGYTCKGATRSVNVLLDIGFLYSASRIRYSDNAISLKENELSNNSITESLNFHQLTGKLGFGVSIPFFKRWELRFVPTFYYNLNHISSEVIATRLFNFGLNTGIAVHF